MTRMQVLPVVVQAVLLCLAQPTISADITAPSATALYYVHARKAGGTTVGHYLRQWLSSQGCCGAGRQCKEAPFFMSSIKLHGNLEWHCDGTASFPSIHFIENEYHCLHSDRFLASSAAASTVVSPLPPTGVRFISVTILRHPIDRLISQWWYHGGPGNRLLTNHVAELCLNLTTTAHDGAASAQEELPSPRGLLHERPRGLLQRPGLQGAPCYHEALAKAHREASSSSEIWEQEWLDKHPSRLHLFRSLHSEYVANYYVRRFVAGVPPKLAPSDDRNAGGGNGTSSRSLSFASAPSPPPAPPPRADHARGALDQEGGSYSGGNARAGHVLGGLRQRCNLRSSRAPLTRTGDLAKALEVLDAFSAVLIMEFLAAPLTAWPPRDAMLRRLQRLLGDGAPPIELLEKVTRLGVAREMMPTGMQERAGSLRAASAPTEGGTEAQGDAGSGMRNGGASGRGGGSDRFFQEAAAGLGRGKQWREKQLPAKTLKRLEEENALDAALYEVAVQQALAGGGADS